MRSRQGRLNGWVEEYGVLTIDQTEGTVDADVPSNISVLVQKNAPGNMTYQLEHSPDNVGRIYSLRNESSNRTMEVRMGNSQSVSMGTNEKRLVLWTGFLLRVIGR